MSSATGPADRPRPARSKLAFVVPVLAVAAFIGYQLLLHRLISAQPQSLLAKVLILVPFLLCATWLALRSRFGLAGGIALLIAGLAGGVALHRSGMDGLLPVIPDLAIYLALLAWFGLSLRNGREPLVTYMARHVHESLSAELAAYTRRVTAAWCVFFFCMAVTSLALFLLAPIETWSVFANLLNLPLVIAMFLGEYLWRMLRHRDLSRASIPTMVRAFMTLGSTDRDSSRGA